MVFFNQFCIQLVASSFGFSNFSVKQVRRMFFFNFGPLLKGSVCWFLARRNPHLRWCSTRCSPWLHLLKYYVSWQLEINNYFAAGLRFSRVLHPVCLGVIHEIIHFLCSWIVFLINYHSFSSLSLQVVGSRAHHWFPPGNVFASEWWVQLTSSAG